VSSRLSSLSDWWNGTLADLDSWWSSQLSEINETFGWIGDFRDNLAAFFGDPLEFLLSRFADWFLGPE